MINNLKRSDIQTFAFSNPGDHNQYQTFSSELENNPLIAFHGTGEDALDSILENGFWFGTESKSVSFSMKSPVALWWACNRRGQRSPDGCILAVQFDAVKMSIAAQEGDVVQVYRPEALPDFLGYCIVPSAYLFR